MATLVEVRSEHQTRPHVATVVLVWKEANGELREESHFYDPCDEEAVNALTALIELQQTAARAAA